ncbi:MAG: Clp protease N-terminal domain-containing protein, partial [Planctomycetota bacterium]
MFDRFTDHARNVMGYARQEAQRLCHDYLGTEHMLVGVVQVINSTAATVLRSEDVDLARVRAKVDELVPHGATLVTMGQIPFTPGGKTALELSLQAAVRSGDNFIGTAYLLLGLIREDGMAARVLDELGVN